MELDIDLAEDGNQDSDDFIRVSYLLDGGTAVSLVQLNDDYGSVLKVVCPYPMDLLCAFRS